MYQHLSANLVKNTKFIWHNINRSIHTHARRKIVTLLFQAELFKDIKITFDNNYLSFFLTKVGSE